MEASAASAALPSAFLRVACHVPTWVRTCVAPALLAEDERPAAVEAFVNEAAVTCCLLTLDHSQSAGLTLTVRCGVGEGLCWAAP